jgi:hypothetical protein
LPNLDPYREIANLRSRIEKLERSPRLPNSSQRGGTQKLLAPDGATVLFEFGEFVDEFAEDRYGLALRDSVGNPAFVVDELQIGRVYPGEHHQWSVQTSQNIATASWVNVASTEIQFPALSCIVAQARVTTPATTTAQVRIFDPFWPPVGLGTTAVTVPASSDGIVRFVWQHPYTVGWDVAAPELVDAVTRLHWQVTRASGAGTIQAYPPWNFYFVSNRAVRDEATTGGGTFTVNGSGIW